MKECDGREGAPRRTASAVIEEMFAEAIRAAIPEDGVPEEPAPADEVPEAQGVDR
jgi:hypothetical protein